MWLLLDPANQMQRSGCLTNIIWKSCDNFILPAVYEGGGGDADSPSHAIQNMDVIRDHTGVCCLVITL